MKRYAVFCSCDTRGNNLICIQQLGSREKSTFVFMTWGKKGKKGKKEEKAQKSQEGCKTKQHILLQLEQLYIQNMQII